MDTVDDNLYELLLENNLVHYQTSLARSDYRIVSVPQLLSYSDVEIESHCGIPKQDYKRLKKAYRSRAGTSTFSRKLKHFGSSRQLAASKHSLDTAPTDLIASHMRFDEQSLSNYLYGHGVKNYANWCLGRFKETSVCYWNCQGRKQEVMLKKITAGNLKNGVESFVRSQATFFTFRHDNVARLLGFILPSRHLNDSSHVIVVQEHASRNLRQYLGAKRLEPSHDVVRLCSILEQVAAGMAALHRLRVYHGNLTLENLLISPNNDQIKITDAQLYSSVGGRQDDFWTCTLMDPASRSMPNYPFLTASPQTLLYGIVNESTDVWSFGVLCWQIFSYGESPQPGSKLHVDDWSSKISTCPTTELFPRPRICPREHHELTLNCCHADPAKRASFVEIRKTLSEVQPTIVMFAKDFNSYRGPGALQCHLHDYLVVLDKRPDNSVSEHLWLALKRGSDEIGLYAHFDAHFVANLAANSHHNTASMRVSKRSSNSKLSLEMISQPMDDVRHTAHVGSDGSAFGGGVNLVVQNTPVMQRKKLSLPVTSPKTMANVADKNETPRGRRNDEFFVDLGPSLLDEIVAALGPDSEAVDIIKPTSERHSQSQSTDEKSLSNGHCSSTTSDATELPFSSPTSSSASDNLAEHFPDDSSAESVNTNDDHAEVPMIDQEATSCYSQQSSTSSGLGGSIEQNQPASSQPLLGPPRPPSRTNSGSPIQHPVLSSFPAADGPGSVVASGSSSLRRSQRMVLPVAVPRVPHSESPTSETAPSPTTRPQLLSSLSSTSANSNLNIRPIVHQQDRSPMRSISTTSPATPTPFNSTTPNRLSARLSTFAATQKADNPDVDLTELLRSSEAATDLSQQTSVETPTAGSPPFPVAIGDSVNLEKVLSVVVLTARQLGLTYASYGDKFWSQETDTKALNSCGITKPVPASNAQAKLQEIFGQTLTTAVCVKVLQECKLSGQWNVPRCIKYLKLKLVLYYINQRFGVGRELLLGYNETAKRCLLEANWEVAEAMRIFESSSAV